MPNFTQIEQNPKEEFEKVGFPVFAILQKNFLPEVGMANRKLIQLHSENLGIQGFKCTTYGLGVIGKNVLA